MGMATSREANTSATALTENASTIATNSNAATSSTSPAPNSGTHSTSMGAGATIGVGDFVEASFASFEKTYGFNTSTTSSKTAQDNNSSKDSNEKEPRVHYFSIDFSLLYQTILYSFLPFLFFCARRSMFGVASLLRSFLIGHALRLLMTFFPGISSTTSPSSMPLPIFIKEKVSSVLLSTGSNTGGNSSNSQNNNHFLDWLQYCQVVIVGKLGGDPHSCPPPSLALLALLTVVAFVVHPDGLTWVLLGKLRDLLSNLIRSLKIFINMIRDGHVPTLAASGSLAAILALAGVLYRASGSTPKCTKQSRKDRHTGNHHNSRGKKKRGGRRGGGGGSNHHERRSGKHSNRIKRASGNGNHNKPKILGTLSESLEENGNEQHKGKNSKVIEETSNYVPVTEIPGRKLTDPSPDDASIVSTLSTEPSITSCSLENGGNGSNNTTTSPSNFHTKAQKKVASNGNIVAGSSTATISYDFQPKRDQKRNKKSKKQNCTTPLRGHKQKNSISYSSPKQTSVKSHNRFGFSSVTISPPFSSSQPQSMQSENVRKSSQKLQYKKDRESSISLQDKYKKVNNEGSNSYFSSEPIPTSLPDHIFSTQAPSSVISSPREVNIVQPKTQSDNSIFSSSFEGFMPMTSIRNKSATHQAVSNNHTYNSYGDRSTLVHDEKSNKSIQYNVPSYSNAYSYNYAQIPKNPGKIELAGLLAQAGLIGRSCAELLRDIPDVEALSQLKEEQFEMYNVSKQTQIQIQALMEVRKRRMNLASASYTRPPTVLSAPATSSSAIRPPPGLGFGDLSYSSSFSKNEESPSAITTSHVEKNQLYHKQYNEHGLDSNAFVEPVTLQGSPEGVKPLVPVNHVLNMNMNLDAGLGAQGHVSKIVGTQKLKENEEDDESIEADLLSQVGGQMAVSILDF